MDVKQFFFVLGNGTYCILSSKLVPFSRVACSISKIQIESGSVDLYDIEMSSKCHSQGLPAACQGFNCTETNWRTINGDDNGTRNHYERAFTYL